MSQHTRAVIGLVTAARRDEVDAILNDVWQWADPGTSNFTMALAPNEQAPPTHYGFYNKVCPEPIASALAFLTDGVLPEETWAAGVPTGNAPVWGQGNLPSQAAAIASCGGGNLEFNLNAGSATPENHFFGFIGPRNLVWV